MPLFSEYVEALQRCMAAEPPSADYALSKDSSQLATVFAEMQVYHQGERPLEELSEKQLAAYNRWKK